MFSRKVSRVTSPAIRSGVSPDALKAILIVSGILTLIFGLVLLVGGIADIGWVTGSLGWFDTAAAISDVAPVVYILFAVGLFCLAYAYNVSSGYTTGGCLIGLAVVAWIFAGLTSMSGVLILGIVLGAFALAVGVHTNRTVKDMVPLMKAPKFAVTGGKLILLFGIFNFVGMLMIISSIWLGNMIWTGGSALASTGTLLGGIGGILLFAAFLVVCAKPAPTPPPAVAPPKEKVPIKPAPPKMRAPPKLTATQTEWMVYGYLVDHGGEIDISKCAEELKISKSDVEKAVEALEAKGKLER